MKANTSFIKEQFKNISKNYNLEWFDFDENGGVLKNNKVKIIVSTERWEEGIIISLRNSLKDEFYYPEDIETIYNIESYNSFLTTEEQTALNNINEGNDKLIFCFRILLERFCDKALRGDFSELGEGR